MYTVEEGGITREVCNLGFYGTHQLFAQIACFG